LSADSDVLLLGERPVLLNHAARRRRYTATATGFDGQLVLAATGVHEATALELVLTAGGSGENDLGIGETIAIIVLGDHLTLRIGQPQVGIITHLQRLQPDRVSLAGFQIDVMDSSAALRAISVDVQYKRTARRRRRHGATLAEADG